MNTETARRVLSVTTYDRTLPDKKIPWDDADVWIGRWPSIPYLRIAWHTYARLKILRHCYETPTIEAGGVLLGGIYRSPNVGGVDDLSIDFIEIEDSIQAECTNATVGQIEFTPESWARINLERDQKFPHLQILGWYHTHPGHGVFLSEQDLFVHNNFFAQDFQLALVIDTHAHYGAFFVDSSVRGGPYKSESFHWHHDLVLWINQVRRPTADIQRSVQPSESGAMTPVSRLTDPEISISLEELESASPHPRSVQDRQVPSRSIPADLSRSGQRHGNPSPSRPMGHNNLGHGGRQRGLPDLRNNPVRLLAAIGLALLVFVLSFVVAFSLLEGLLPGKYGPLAFALVLAVLAAFVTFLVASLG